MPQGALGPRVYLRWPSWQYVLVGSALALGGYLGAQIVAASGFSGPGSGYQLRDILEMVGVLVVPIAGAVLALSPRRQLVRPREVPIPA